MKKMQRLFVVFILLGFLAACSDDAASTDMHPRDDAGGADATSDTVGDDSWDEDARQNGPDGGDESDVDERDSEDEDTIGPGRECRSDEECPGAQVCAADRSVSPIELHCVTPQPGGGELGDACSTDAQCQSNLCVEDQCAAACERPVDCSDDGSFRCEPTEISADDGSTEEVNLCRPLPPTECASDADCTSGERCQAKKDSDSIVFECAPGQPGGEIGDSCSQDSDCAQNLCLEGVCSGPCGSGGDCRAAEGFACERTTIDLGNGESASGQVCAPPRACERNDQCRVGEVCRVDRASGEAHCGPKNSSGGSVGDVCTSDAGCAENLCYDGRFRDVCSRACERDSDCSKPGYECRDAEVGDGQGSSNTMKICAPKDPPACTSSDDCASGLTCAVVSNAAGSALERACIPAAGKATGVACTDDNQCSSLVCINGACSDPCNDTAQCGTDQLCRSNNVSKDGLSATFDMCEVLDEERCDQDGVCSDGVRMCNEIYQVSGSNNVYEAYCGMPSSSGTKSLGDSCTGDAQCRSNICLSEIGDDCSVVCDRDSQCGPNQVCGNLRLGASQFGYCMTSCARNNDCSGLDFTQNGDSIEHICTINIDFRNDGVDQICARRTPTDSSGNPLGKLGADCESTTNPGEPDDALCQGGLCQQNTLFGSTSCTSDSQCGGGEKCVDAGGGNGKRCAEQTFACTRVCANNSDCSGGEPGNTMTSCSQSTAISLPDGSTELIATCSES